MPKELPLFTIDGRRIKYADYSRPPLVVLDDEGYTSEGPPIDVGAIVIVAVILIIALGSTVADILENTLLEPWSELITLFTGRPKEQATAQIVEWLGKQTNPAAKLWSNVLGRMLKEWDIVVSDSSAAGQKLLSQPRNAFIQSLIAQGMTNKVAQGIANIAMSSAAEDGSAVIDQFKTPAPAGLTFIGDQALSSMFSEYLQNHSYDFTDGDQAMLEAALKYTIYNGPLAKLLTAQINFPPPQSYTSLTPTCQTGYTYNYSTQTCNSNLVQPTGPQSCPPNYTYDNTTYLCTYTPPASQLVPPPPPPPTSTIPPPPTPSPGGDELTQCCQSTAFYLYSIATAISQLASASGGSSASSTCCAQIVAQLTAISTAIAAIPAAIPAPVSSAPVDLTGVIALLTQLSTNLVQIDADNNANAAALTAAVTNVGNAIANAPPTDVSGIVTQLTNLVTQGDVPQSVLDYLLAQGYISSNDAQVIEGAPWAEVIVTVFRTWGWNALLWLASWVGITYTGSTWSLNGLGEGISKVISQAVSSALTAGAAPLLPEITGLIDGVSSTLQPTGAVSLGNIGVNPDLLLAKTLAPALILNAVALVGSYLGWEISEPLEKYVDWASALTGLEELKDVLIGSLFRNGLVRVTDMQTKAIFKQELPSTERMFQWSARGWMTAARATALAPYNGTPDELIPIIQNDSYTNLPARLLVRIFDSPTFSQTDLLRVFQEHGMRPADTTDYVNALPYLATASQRTQLVATYEKA